MSVAPLQACLLHFDDETDAAERLGRAAQLPVKMIDRHRFPDGELKLRLPVDGAGCLPTHLVLLRSLHDPNEKLVELLLTARAARTLGARHITLVAPYMAYMRQDIAFAPGEVVSQQVVGGFLAGLVDAVITVDPHLHRVATLQEAMAVPQAIVLSGAEPLADLIAQRHPNALLWGPMANRPSGLPRQPPAMALTMPFAPRCAMAIAMWLLSCRRSTPRGVRWCCWTTWPAPAIPWPRPRGCCGRRARHRWMWP